MSLFHIYEVFFFISLSTHSKFKGVLMSLRIFKSLIRTYSTYKDFKELMYLQDWMDVLSGGEKQRVAVSTDVLSYFLK